MSQVKISHVFKRFGEVTAVNDFNIDIADGEFISFLGPSGCGKTTTLRMVAGFERATEGEIVIGDNVVIIGGGLVGFETAEYLANKGYKVTIIEMMDKIAAQESSTVLPLMMADFKEHNVTQLVKTKVNGISEDGHVIYATDTAAEKDIEIAKSYLNNIKERKNDRTK